MKLNPFSAQFQTSWGWSCCSDRLAVAALDGERVEAFSIDAENPARVLREELNKRQLSPRTVALGLARGSVFVKPIDLPSVGSDLREMVRLNLDGYLPFAAEDAPFDFVTLPAPPEPPGARSRWCTSWSRRPSRASPTRPCASPRRRGCDRPR